LTPDRDDEIFQLISVLVRSGHIAGQCCAKKKKKKKKREVKEVISPTLTIKVVGHQ
jgi:hypothetical protein